MNIQKQDAVLVDREGLKKIELIGRNCYKSIDKIKDGSDIEFCNNLIASGHTAPFMHEWVYFNVLGLPETIIIDLLLCHKYMIYKPNLRILAFNYRVFIDDIYSLNKYMGYDRILHDINKMNAAMRAMYMLTGELHPLFGKYDDNTKVNILAKKYSEDIRRVYPDEIKEICPDILAITFFIRTDRGVTHEIVRHTEMSFMQESTRYCNYSKDKFDNSINVIEPKQFDNDITEDVQEWYDAMADAEAHYMNLTQKYHWTPQDARSVLPTATKADIFVTAPARSWVGEECMGWLADKWITERKGFIQLRHSSQAHPMINYVAGLIKSIMEIKLPKLFQ